MSIAWHGCVVCLAQNMVRLRFGVCRISVNMTSFSAKLLTSAIYNPRNIMVFSQVHHCYTDSILSLKTGLPMLTA